MYGDMSITPVASAAACNRGLVVRRQIQTAAVAVAKLIAACIAYDALIPNPQSRVAANALCNFPNPLPPCSSTTCRVKPTLPKKACQVCVPNTASDRAANAATVTADASSTRHRPVASRYSGISTAYCGL